MKENFKMIIEDIFVVPKRGTVVCGKIESGTISINDAVEICDLNSNIIKTSILAIEFNRKLLNSIQASDEYVGILLKDVDRNIIHKGDVLLKNNNGSL